MRVIILEHPAVINDAYYATGAHVEVPDDFPLPAKSVLSPEGQLVPVALAHEYGEPPAVQVQNPDVAMTDEQAGVVPGHTDYEVHRPGETGYTGPASASVGPLEDTGYHYPPPEPVAYADEEAEDEEDDAHASVDETTGKKKKKSK